MGKLRRSVKISVIVLGTVFFNKLVLFEDRLLLFGRRIVATERSTSCDLLTSLSFAISHSLSA